MKIQMLVLKGMFGHFSGTQGSSLHSCSYIPPQGFVSLKVTIWLLHSCAKTNLELSLTLLRLFLREKEILLRHVHRGGNAL